ncbi:protein DnaJ [Seminavis robusta]|uniref:Protein DnaJ n=1 Tax=Seminavis robusta TaxID=568900 RepID=A0A9N8HGV5_9STRA|nr:protein DnaJ [Seminavis robusta]|eukprot:Sro505_g156140.1 protein DnaJ (2163) ;mRNA; f:24017-30819
MLTKGVEGVQGAEAGQKALDIEESSTMSETLPCDSMELEDDDTDNQISDPSCTSTDMDLEEADKENQEPEQDACPFFDIVLVRLLEHLKAMENDIDDDSLDEPNAEPKFNGYGEGIDKAKCLWQQIKLALDNAKPPMSEDPCVVNLLVSVGETLEAESMQIEEIQSLQSKLMEVLDIMRPLDVDKLCSLLKEHAPTCELVDGKNIILLLGDSGAGKTTTMLYLTGVTFDEVEEEGEFHLRPVEFPDPKLAQFRTGGGSSSMTKTLQCVEVTTDEQHIVLCDVPGFRDTAGAEVDIANGLGIVRAIQRAKGVKLVLVLSQAGIGDRFQGLNETLDSITRLMVNDFDSACAEAFGYLFTKFEPKHGPVLHKKFRSAAAKKEVFKGLRALLEDMATKTNPRAQLVNPLDGKAQDLVRVLCAGSSFLDPKTSFKEFTTESASNKLQLQLQYLKSAFDDALQRMDFCIATRCLKQLEQLADVLSEAKASYRQVSASAVHFLDEARQKVSSCAQRFRNVVEHDTFADDLEALKAATDELRTIESFRDECFPNELSVSIFCDGVIGDVVAASGRRLLRYDPSLSMEDILRLLDSFAGDLRRLREAHQTFPESNCSQSSYLRGVDQYTAIASRIVGAAEASLQLCPIDLHAFFKMAEAHETLRNQFVLLDPASESVKSMEWLQQHLMDMVQSKVASSINDISTQTASLKDGVKVLLGRDEPSCLPPLNLFSLKESRDLLSAFAEASGQFHDFVAVSDGDIQSALQNLDSTVIENFSLILEHSRKSLARIKLEEEANGLMETHNRLENLRGLCLRIKETFCGLERWPGRVRQEGLPLFENLNAHQHALHEYNAKLEGQIDEARKEMADVASQAKAFLHRLQTEVNNTAGILEELSRDEYWPMWEEKRKETSGLSKKQQVEKKGFWGAVGAVLGFGDDTASQATCNEDALDQTLNEIIVVLQGYLALAMRSLCGVQWGTLSCSQLLSVFFGQATPEIVLCLTFMRLQHEKHSLGKAILAHRNGSGIMTSLTKTEGAMAFALKQLIVQSQKLLCSHLLVETEQLLVLLKKNSHVIESFRVLLSCDGFLQPTSSQRNRDAFIESINGCPDYERLRSKAIATAVEIESRFNLLSLIDERRILSANEFDRSSFYRSLRSQLQAAACVSCLAPHAMDDTTRAKLHTLALVVVPALVRETEKIGLEINKIMSRFPNALPELSLLNIWLGNLSTIKTIFEDDAPAVAERARKLRREAESSLAENLDTIAEAPSPVLAELVPQLIRLKKVSSEIGYWQAKIDRCIDKVISRASSAAPNTGRFILDLSVALKKVEEDDEAVVHQILSQHECFGGAMNAVFNAATARQGIDYVVRGLGFTKEQSNRLKRLYNDFGREYSTAVRDGLLEVLDGDTDVKEQFFESLYHDAASVASDLATDYEAQLTSLCALLFAYWSLSKTNSFVLQHQNDRNFLSGEDPMNFLRKPHAAQVVAVLSLLNFQESRLQVLKSHMCELKTGEGKSIVLGITATILGMLGCTVDCVCYSRYLSDRDYKDFVDMFRRFRVQGCVRYNSIGNFCSRMVFQRYKALELAENVLLRKPNRPNLDRGRGTLRLKVLLVDEVDVFFKEDFFGRTYNPLWSHNTPEVSDLAHYIWDNINTLCHDNLLFALPAQKVVRRFPSEVQPLIEQQIRHMLDDAQIVSTGRNEKYCIVDDEIAYKELDGLTTNTRYGYQTLFAYIKEHEEGKIKNLADNLYVQVMCVKFSYAELPAGFDAILGVTGTLSGFGDLKMDILKNSYGIQHFSHIPSVYGKNKLTFAGDCPRDVILCDSTDDHHLEIRSEIDRRRKPLNGVEGVLRPVMVFFACRRDMEAFYSSEHMKAFRESNAVRMVSEETDPSEKQSAFTKATESGAITLFIREYGRGTDFKCFDSKVLQAGGAHVIQSFFAVDIAEELQLKGRTARQGAEGSFSMVLHVKDLKGDLGVTRRDVETMQNESKFYSILDERRTSIAQKKLDSVSEKVEHAENLHYRSVAFVKAAREGRREEALDFLFEMNSVSGRGRKSFVGNNEKPRFLAEREARLKTHLERQRERRRSAEESAPECKLPQVLLLEDKDTSHYGVLGVSHNATKMEISRAFRRLAKIHHPDKSSHENANEIFCRIKEARNVLLNDEKRAAYDRELERNNDE